MNSGLLPIPTILIRTVVSMALLLPVSCPTFAVEPDTKLLASAYELEIQPLLRRYCHECHAGERMEAEIDLAAISNWSDVRKHTKTWQKVAEMLDSGQMPPQEARQPTEAELVRLRQWVHDYLSLEVQARAGDPGRVVLRRLSNAEYTYTLRDLTGLDQLNPAREFPVDGAAGEGFTNTGNALVMSPALVTKYLDAAKEVARHAVLLPNEFRFSTHMTARDLTDETLAKIRDFYAQFTDSRGGDKVNLQGVVFDTNEGGRLPLDKYLTATLAERDRLAKGEKSIDAVAQERGLNAKYLTTLWSALNCSEESLVLGGIRKRWRTAKPEDAAALAADIAAWQKGLWRFTTVGHIGKAGGPTRWLEPVNPLVAKQELRFKIPPSLDGQDVVISLVASDAGDGNEHDFVVWQRPRLVAPGRPDLLLRDLRGIAHALTVHRQRMFADTAKYLEAASEASATNVPADLAQLTATHGVETTLLQAWLDYLGIRSADVIELRGHFIEKLTSAAGYDFIQGWGSHNTPLLLANSSDQHVRVPGNMKPHSVAIHPSPTLRASIGWRSPVAASVRVEAAVTHAHPECGNGVTWTLDLRRGVTRKTLATGATQGSTQSKIGPLTNLSVSAGDVVCLSIGPRDGNHSCDLTQVDMQLTSEANAEDKWNLAADVSPNVLSGNPHSDQLGNGNVWHFFTEPDNAALASPVIPDNSTLAKWQLASDPESKRKLADQLQALLTSPPPAAKNDPDAELYRQLTSLGGPLLGGARNAIEGLKEGLDSSSNTQSAEQGVKPESLAIGLDPGLFGKHPRSLALDGASLCVKAPSVVEVRLPADLVAGCELVTMGVLDPSSGAEGTVQLEVISGRPALDSGLLPSKVTETVRGGQWTGNNRSVSFGSPILVHESSSSRKRVESAFDEFRQLFPAALCYTKIVPVDEVVTLTLFYREDDHLVRLMLDDSQREQLDRLWDELHYISRDALTLVDAFTQLMEFATQDADPKVFEPLRKPINDRAEAFQQQLIASESKHVDALVRFADRAYRRPLTVTETSDLRAMYANLRKQEISHEDAFRLTLARILVAPAFLYRVEKPAAGKGQSPVADWELATRLSYFLWSSQPDEALRRMAEEGRLHDPDVLLSETRRMLRNEKTRRMAIEFACQWLHINNFDQLDEKSERHFPNFLELRDEMYEESIQFFTDLFQNNGSVLDILDADYTFLNEDLARHYGIPGIESAQWRRVEGVKKYARGGILAQATTLATQSGASRTSPILRGNWVSEVLLGERLPRPPKGVPPLPDDEAATDGLTVRQLVEKHASDAKCSVCHQRIDPFGFSLEGFDAIGRLREKDLGDRPIDTRVKAMDGKEFEGLDGLRNYLLTTRREAFMRQFCRKLLGYALGRSVQLSDEPLLAQMQNELKDNDYRVAAAIETIVLSRQFREIRGIDSAFDD